MPTAALTRLYRLERALADLCRLALSATADNQLAVTLTRLWQNHDAAAHALRGCLARADGAECAGGDGVTHTNAASPLEVLARGESALARSYELAIAEKQLPAGAANVARVALLPMALENAESARRLASQCWEPRFPAVGRPEDAPELVSVAAA